MIIAYRNSTLALATLLAETATHWEVQMYDQKKPTKIAKDGKVRRVFDDVNQAIEWIEQVRGLEKGTLMGDKV